MPNGVRLSAAKKPFEGTRHALTSHPALVMPDYSEPFEVVCDASRLPVTLQSLVWEVCCCKRADLLLTRAES